MKKESIYHPFSEPATPVCGPKGWARRQEKMVQKKQPPQMEVAVIRILKEEKSPSHDSGLKTND